MHSDSTSIPGVRLDRWLCAARVFKSRTLAATACGAGHVSVNGNAVRASHAVKVGDEVRAKPPRGPVVLIVLKLADKRLSPKDAVLLYEDRSPPPPPPDEFVFRRERGAGRPTKAERRQMDKMRRW